MLQSSFDEQDIVRIVNDLIIAAADTTSYSTLWTIYLLSLRNQNPEITGKFPTLDSHEIKNACREAMRLYPVAPFLTRIQQSPLEFDGYSIESGQLILISIYAMGRNSDYFPDPDKFDPDRWIRNTKTGKLHGVRHGFASLPFSFGPRSCIGKELAKNQMEYLISSLFRDFDVQVLNDHPVQMEMRLIGLPESTIRLRLKKKLNFIF